MASGDRDARRQALEVPFPRPFQGLVEIIEVEHQLALGGRKQPEVGQMRVAARLHRQTRDRSRLEVGGHNSCCRAIKGKRRGHHPTASYRDEPVQAVMVLFLNQADRVGSRGSRRPFRMACARRLFA